jgi:hypothetical protein
MCATVLPDGRRFGDVRLGSMSWQEVEQCFVAMKAAGKGADWVRRCATVLSRALGLVRKRGLIDANPCEDAARPRSTRVKPFSPTVDEMRTLLAVARDRDPELGDIAVLLASTGMRKGELQVLIWRDIDLDKSEVHIAAAISDGGRGAGAGFGRGKPLEMGASLTDWPNLGSSHGLFHSDKVRWGLVSGEGWAEPRGPIGFPRSARRCSRSSLTPRAPPLGCESSARL